MLLNTAFLLNFAFHGYPTVIRELLYKRNRLVKVFGYEEEGAITTPFDMRVLNSIDRYHLVISAIDSLGNQEMELKNECVDTLMRHYEYIRETGKDLDEVLNWKWEDAE